MTNIWDFLLQTVEVSVTAVVILIVKRLFQDKLSPRWQYAIWILLAGKILLPAHFMGRYLSVTVAAGLEVVKTSVESGLSSAYTQLWVPIGQNASVIPYIDKLPESLTDWLFLLYIAGAVFSVAWYAVAYARLRGILQRGRTGEKALQEKIEDVCKRHCLSACKVVVADGIPSAFVCGFFCPILVIPAESENNIDEKILLHELLHRTYADALQNVFWCLMRALHWCNPFLQYVFNRIGNDMESLCDQRVLEDLDGEDRREYGKILLSMTDQKYARAPGTTSISNGGKNIKRRIEAIARFKKYPRGMALVSVCVLVMLAAPVFAGNDLDGYEKELPGLSKHQSQLAMAKARMNRCTTQAGAIDTWVKGKVFNLPAYLAAVTPYAGQEELQRQLEERKDFSLEITRSLKGGPFSDYAVYNLHKESENCYTALAVFASQEEDTVMPQAVVAIPLTLRWENGWTVTQTGHIQEYDTSLGLDIFWGSKEMPSDMISEARGKNGIVRLKEQTVKTVDNQVVDEDDVFADMMGNGYAFNINAKRSATFSEEKLFVWGEYQDCRSRKQRRGIQAIGMMAAVLEHLSDNVPDDVVEEEYFDQEVSGSSNDGVGYDFRKIEGTWDGNFDDLNFLLWDSPDSEFVNFEGFEVRVYQDGKLLESLKIKRGAKL